MLQERRQQQKEILTDNPVSDGNYEILDDVMSELPLLMQLENVKLLHALRVLDEKERQVFFARVLDEKSFEELDTGGMGIKLARMNSDDMVYARRQNRNVLTLKFYIKDI